MKTSGKREKEKIMRAIERDTEKEDQEPTPSSSCSNYGLNRFTSFPDLKHILEKEANLIEVNMWLKQINQYIKAVYRNNQPATSVYMHLSPLLHQRWKSALDSKNPEVKSLKELLELVREEAILWMPRHQRRMNLIQMKGFRKTQ